MEAFIYTNERVKILKLSSTDVRSTNVHFNMNCFQIDATRYLCPGLHVEINLSVEAPVRFPTSGPLACATRKNVGGRLEVVLDLLILRLHLSDLWGSASWCASRSAKWERKKSLNSGESFESSSNF